LRQALAELNTCANTGHTRLYWTSGITRWHGMQGCDKRALRLNLRSGMPAACRGTKFRTSGSGASQLRGTSGMFLGILLGLEGAGGDCLAAYLNWDARCWFKQLISTCGSRTNSSTGIWARLRVAGCLGGGSTCTTGLFSAGSSGRCHELPKFTFGLHTWPALAGSVSHIRDKRL
jgi:hypothetical protein